MSTRRAVLELDGVTYRMGFDERRDASRFMVSTGRELVAQGLIDGQVGREPVIICDEPERPLDPRIADALLGVWRLVREGL